MGDGERNIEDLADGIFVFFAVEASEDGAAGAIVFEEGLFEPGDDGGAIVCGRLGFVFGGHVTGFQHVPGLGPADGRVRIVPIDLEEIEVDVAFLGIGVMAIEAVFDEESVDVFGERARIGPGNSDALSKQSDGGEEGSHLKWFHWTGTMAP